MTREEAEEALCRLNAAIATAVLVINGEKEVLDRFFAEQRSFDTIAPILDPTLWNSSERRATEALLSPIYKAAKNLIVIYDAQTSRAAKALAEVDGEND